MKKRTPKAKSTPLRNNTQVSPAAEPVPVRTAGLLGTSSQISTLYEHYCVLLGINMPEGGGINVLQELQELGIDESSLLDLGSMICSWLS